MLEKKKLPKKVTPNITSVDSKIQFHAYEIFSSNLYKSIVWSRCIVMRKHEKKLHLFENLIPKSWNRVLIDPSLETSIACTSNIFQFSAGESIFFHARVAIWPKRFRTWNGQLSRCVHDPLDWSNGASSTSRYSYLMVDTGPIYTSVNYRPRPGSDTL